jgi:SAM-dependent methyltransferase
MLRRFTKQRQIIRRLVRPAWVGTLRRTTPLSDRWGIDRGLPVDRYYIERFLDQHRQDIRGRVLEIKDSNYTQRFGTGVQQSDVLDIDAHNPQATLVADLAAADSIPAETFDCFIFTQTLQRIYAVESAIMHTYRILRPGGVLLATLPALCRVERCCKSSMSVQTFGNVLTAIAFLTGMAAEELSSRELETYDPCYPIVVAIRAIK